MEDELFRRLDQIENKCTTAIGECSSSLNECSKNMELMQKDIKHQNENTQRSMHHIEQMLDTQHIILNGNPHQDSKDRGLIGDVDQLKTSEARKKKYYWAIVTAVIMVLIPSFWNIIFGKADHGRSTEIKTNKTGPSSSSVLRHNRSRRE